MQMLGIMMAVVGLILLASARGVYRGGQKTTEAYKDMPGDNDSFLILLSNGMLVLRIIGGLLMVVGVIFIVM